MVSYTTTMTLTDEGKNRFLMKALQKDANGFKFAIGGGITQPTVDDVSLENQLYSIAPVYIEVIDNIAYISAFFDTTYFGEINEIGLLDATDDMLMARTVLSSPIIKNDDNTLTIDIQIEI